MNIKKAIPHIIAILTIVLVNVAYFYPQLENKVVRQGDILSSSQAGNALKTYRAETGKTYLWDPAQFGGMPILSGPPSYNNIIFNSYKLLKMGFNEPIGMFIAGSLLAYIVFILLGVNPWLSLIFALCTMLTTNNMILWEAGHNSKIRTLIFTPLLIGGVLSIFENRKYLLGFVLLALGFSLSFFTRHPQMTYYILLVFMIYGIIILVQTIKKRDWTHFAKGTALVIVAGALGASTSITKLWSLQDYSTVTMRGDAILKSDASKPSGSGEVDGLDWEYAMQWSNDHKDLMATFIPGFVGGGSGEKVSTKSKSFQNYKIKEAPLYWGNLPFTEGPIYLGASILFLFVFALFFLQGNLRWWLGIGLVWMYLLSMGKNFGLLNEPMFDFMPFYSKFRAPASLLSVTPYFITLLAALGLSKFFKVKFNSKKNKEKYQKKYTKDLLISYGIVAGLSVLVWLLGPSMFDFSANSDSRYAQQGVDLSVFISDRKSLMRGDAIRTLLIVSAIAGALYAYLKLKISKYVAFGILGFVCLIDFLGVSWRYLDHDKFIPKREYESGIADRLVDQQIKNLEKDRHGYRVHDLTINTFNSSEASFAHNTIGGYHPAKMQRASDLIERHISKNNFNVLNMLNTKYLIVPGQNGAKTIRPNGGALGNGWFVNNIQKVTTANQEIDALTSFDPSSTAVVLDSEFGEYVNSLGRHTDSTATISITAYEPDRITYQSSSSQEGLAVFSEMWYGPDKGWKAYLDGQEVDHIRANYALRAMKIPSGNHEIVFEFKPKPFYMGEKISLVGSIVLILLIIGFIYTTYKNKNGVISQ